MNLTPEQIQEHVINLADATVEDLDDLLHDLCCLAWPTSDGQNNSRPAAGPVRPAAPARRVRRAWPLWLPAGGRARLGGE
jgi:hypothetical protein